MKKEVFLNLCAGSKLFLIPALFLLPEVHLATAGSRSPLTTAQTAVLASAAVVNGAGEGSLQSLAEASVPKITEQAKLVPPFNGFDNFFGHSVSLSGNRALVGAFGSDANGDQMGHAFVFVFDGTTWTQEAELTPSDGTVGNGFGVSVSLSGNRALVGAGGRGVAAAYVFVFDGTTWTQEAKLTPSGGAFSFGASVSLDGTTALIGDPNLQHFKGAAYIFSFNGVTWQQQSRLTVAEGDKARSFGESVSLFDGRAAVGAFGSRSAYVFTKTGSTWTQEAKLTPSDGTSDDLFGETVSLAADRLLVGAPGATFNGVKSGAAYVFDFDGTTWNQEAELAPVDGNENDDFGLSISVAGDHALIGAFAAKNL